MFKWKIRGDPRSYGGSSRAANDGGGGAGVTIQLLRITHFNNNTINVIKVSRHLMHLEMFVQRDSNLRDDQLENTNRGMEHLDRLIDNLTRDVRHLTARDSDLTNRGIDHHRLIDNLTSRVGA